MANDSRKFRTEIPNIVDDADLSVCAFRLYVHIKRRAGDGGVCTEGLRGMASACGMAIGTTQKARTELLMKNFIAVKEVIEKGRHGGKFEHITIVNLWGKNFEHFTALKRSDGGVLPDDTGGVLPDDTGGVLPDDTGGVSRSEQGVCHVVTHKKEPEQEVCETPAERAAPHRQSSSSKPAEAKSSKSSARKESSPPDRNLQHPAVIAYRDICRITPNPQQRADIVSEVTDLDRWQRILKQFTREGQRPQRVDWTLERYENFSERAAVKPAEPSKPVETPAEKQSRLKREMEKRGATHNRAERTTL